MSGAIKSDLVRAYDGIASEDAWRRLQRAGLAVLITHGWRLTLPAADMVSAWRRAEQPNKQERVRT